MLSDTRDSAHDDRTEPECWTDYLLAAAAVTYCALCDHKSRKDLSGWMDCLPCPVELSERARGGLHQPLQLQKLYYQERLTMMSFHGV